MTLARQHSPRKKGKCFNHSGKKIMEAWGNVSRILLIGGNCFLQHPPFLSTKLCWTISALEPPEKEDPIQCPRTNCSDDTLSCSRLPTATVMTTAKERGEIWWHQLVWTKLQRQPVLQNSPGLACLSSGVGEEQKEDDSCGLPLALTQCSAFLDLHWDTADQRGRGYKVDHLTRSWVICPMGVHNTWSGKEVGTVD